MDSESLVVDDSAAMHSHPAWRRTPVVIITAGEAEGRT